jgi:hypothetical protein
MHGDADDVDVPDYAAVAEGDTRCHQRLGRAAALRGSFVPHVTLLIGRSVVAPG